MKRSHSIVAFLVALLIGFAPVMDLNAQNMPPAPATPVPGTAPVGVLAEFDIDELPAPHTEVWFLRMGLEPSGSIPEGSNAGPAIIFVESGKLAISSDEPLVLGETVTADSSADELTLVAGNSVLIPAGVSTKTFNTSNQPTTFLMLLMYSGMDEGQGDTNSDEPVGLSTTGVSIGLAEFGPSPATITMERVIVEQGDSLISPTSQMEGMGPGWMGMDLGQIETGSAYLEVSHQSFNTLIWPPAAEDQMNGPEQIELTTNLRVETGDGYSVFNSSLIWTASGDGPLTILRVVVTPAMGN